MYVFDNYTKFDSTKNIHVKNNASNLSKSYYLRLKISYY